MALWRRIRRGLHVLRHPSAAHREVSDELQHYVEQLTAEHLARGLAPRAARRAARLEVGSATSVEQQVRGYGWENAVETAVADVAYGVRRLRASPGLTAITVLTLALGTGAATAIFSAVNPVLIEPLPYPHASRLLTIRDVGGDQAPLDVTFGTWREVAARSRSFETTAVMKPWQPTLRGGVEPERLNGQRVSAGYFAVLGVPPALGQDFQASWDRAGAPDVVILSDGLWRRHFAAHPSIIGRSIELDGDAYLVIGVMPADFENVPSPLARLWAPLKYDMSEGRAWGHHLEAIGRLRAGVVPDDARRELNALAEHPVTEFARPDWAALDHGFIVDTLQRDVTRAIRPALLAVFGAVLLVLAISCVNVTNLLLVSSVRRGREFALRAALGAGRFRLIRQLLTESLLLAFAGGAIGLLMAQFGVQLITALGPPDMPRVAAIRFDRAVFAFGLAVTTLVALGVGLTPALRTARKDPRDAIRDGSWRTTGRQRTRNALVVVETALALILLVSSGLLLRSVQRLFAVDAGFDASGLLTMQVHTSGPRFTSDSARHQFFARALEAVRSVPGVTAAAMTSQLPMSGDLDLWGVHFDPVSPADPGEVRGTFRYAVSAGYIETMGIILRAGRLLDDRDGATAPRVALISESLARRRLPGMDPIGRRIRIGADERPYTVVGVVGDVKQVSLAADQPDAVYTTPAQWTFADPVMALVIRARGSATALVPAVRRAIASVDRDQPIARIATLDALIARSAADRRFALILFQAFALAALALAAAGIHGVLAGSVAERTHEIGIRAALGASPTGVLGLVIRQGMALVGLGMAIGVAGAALTSRALVALLFGVSRLDPGTYIGVIALFGGVALLACAVPAWRAARVDPAATLRVG